MKLTLIQHLVCIQHPVSGVHLTSIVRYTSMTCDPFSIQKKRIDCTGLFIPCTSPESFPKLNSVDCMYMAIIHGSVQLQYRPDTRYLPGRREIGVTSSCIGKHKIYTTLHCTRYTTPECVVTGSNFHTHSQEEGPAPCFLCRMGMVGRVREHKEIQVSRHSKYVL